MKLILVLALIFTIAPNNQQKQSQQAFNVMNFTNIPKDMEGCGENLFLNKKDEIAEKFIFYTDYFRALMCINNKMILMKGDNKSDDKYSKRFSNADYTVIISYGPQKATGDESYEIISAIVTIKYKSKIIWSKRVIGGGGC